jgi:hypothetical protein
MQLPPRPASRIRAGLAALVIVAIVGTCGPPIVSDDPVPPTSPLAVVAIHQPPWGADPLGIGNPFREHNGTVTQYVRDPEGYDGYRYPPTTWRSITDQIESGWYDSRGINHLLIYGAWRSSEHFLGLPPLDFFDVQEGTGTLADLEAMMAATKARGMGVLMYIELIYAHPDNPIFVKAAADRAADVDSFERRLFRWDDRVPQTGRCPSDAGLPPEASWTSDPSIAGGRCYVQSWGELAGMLPRGLPAFDYERPEAMSYAKRVLGFWIDRGVDGFIFDAAHTYLGMDDPLTDPVHLARQRELHVDFVHDHVRPDGTRAVGWSQDEGVFGEHGAMTTSDLIGFTHIRAQGGGDSDSYASQAIRTPAVDGRTVDQLEDHWATYVDTRRQHGGGAVASLLYGNDIAVPGAIRALDMALVAGGAGLEAYFSYQHHLPTMSPEDQERFFDVLRALDRSSALAPGASRLRLPTPEAEPRSYAVLRRSMDGSRSALALFNLATEETCVTVDLDGSGVVVPQSTIDLATGGRGPEIDASVISIALPPRGWRFLEVTAGTGFPWTVLDDGSGAWTMGGDWQRFPDPSAYGGGRLGGTAAGGFAETTFSGRSVEGWGLKSTDGAEAVDVVIDGVSRGVHSQRRSAPIAGGDTFYGQRLFSVDDLEPGTHTIRLTTVDDGAAGIDYLRVSDEPASPRPRPLPRTDCAS